MVLHGFSWAATACLRVAAAQNTPECVKAICICMGNDDLFNDDIFFDGGVPLTLNFTWAMQVCDHHPDREFCDYRLTCVDIYHYRLHIQRDTINNRRPSWYALTSCAAFRNVVCELLWAATHEYHRRQRWHCGGVARAIVCNDKPAR